MIPKCFLLLAPCFMQSLAQANPPNAPREFIPTSEWQVIPPGTSVPPGLHYRMDLSTGEKMAKLLEPEETHTVDLRKIRIKDSLSSAVLAVTPSEQSLDSSEESPDSSSSSSSSSSSVSSASSSSFSVSSSSSSSSSSFSSSSSSSSSPSLDPFQQKEKILLGTGLFDDVLKANMSVEDHRQLVERLWQQRQDEVRAVYDLMEHADKVIDPFIHALWEATPATPTEELLSRLERLEELISTADMALVFVQRGGWTPLVALLSPRYSSEVRASAAFVVGSALRQNEENKAWALEPRGPGPVPVRSALYQLMEILASPSHPDQEHLLSKAVYALSAAANTNQEVQTHLLGPFLVSLADLLSQPWSSALKIKVMQFGTDMMTSAKEDTDNSEHYARLRQSLGGWCAGIYNLTVQVLKEPAKLEKAMEAAVQVVREACPSSFHALALLFKQAQLLYANETEIQMAATYRMELLEALSVIVGLDREDL